MHIISCCSMAPPKPPILDFRHIPTVLFGDDFRETSDYRVIRPYGSGDYLLTLTMDGSGRVRQGDAEVITQRGDITLYRLDGAQDYGTAPGAKHWHFLWSHFLPRPYWMEWLNWPKKAPQFCHFRIKERTVFDEVTSAMKNMFHALRGSRRVSGALASSYLEQAILWMNEARQSGEAPAMDPRIRSAMDHLSTTLEEPFSLETIARREGLSVSRFAHLFQKETGQTPRAFSEEQKLVNAANLLRLTSLSVKEISIRLGFDSPFYFSLRFRRRFKTSPIFYRETMQTSKPHEGEEIPPHTSSIITSARRKGLR